MKKKKVLIFIFLLAGIFFICKISKTVNINPAHTVGEKLDSLNSVIVYYNGGVSNSEGRNVSADGYNIGMKYQCVEFVKRYYYEFLHHKMPDAYGNAKDFFADSIKSGQLNSQRDLLQFTNGDTCKPKVNDLFVFGPSFWNSFGHVAIVSKVADSSVEIIQQNPGPFGNSRENFPMKKNGSKWEVENKRLKGWLREK
jgi:surface antigen